MTPGGVSAQLGAGGRPDLRVEGGKSTKGFLIETCARQGQKASGVNNGGENRGQPERADSPRPLQTTPRLTEQERDGEDFVRLTRKRNAGKLGVGCQKRNYFVGRRSGSAPH